MSDAQSKIMSSFIQKDGSLIIEIGVPGYDERFLELEKGENRTITITGRARNTNILSLCGSPFIIALTPIPDNVDIEQMSASCIDGLLRIHFPAHLNTAKLESGQYNPFLSSPGNN
jgi:HSP20 family molecular chaperone IbpA